MRIFTVIILGALLCYGCSSSLTSYELDQSSKVVEITTGESSQQDVRSILGNPDWIEIDDENMTKSQTWAYVEYQNFIAPPTVFPALSHPSEPGWYGPEETALGKFNTIYISYSKDGIVEDISTSHGMRGLLNFVSKSASPFSEKINEARLNVRPFPAKCC